MAFRSALRESQKPKGTFEYGALSESEKERLCRSLLSEFGATTIRQGNNGELHVSCVLPWHTDHDPSASLNFKKLVYNCFSCNSSGGLLWFIGICRGTTADKAREWLGSETGGGAEVQDIDALIRYLDSLYEPGNVHAPIPRMSREVLRPWRLIHPYLTEERGIPEDTIKHFEVGYDGDAERIIIPHYWRGALTGWQSRRLIKDGTPKYLNTPDFPREQTLYNSDGQPRGEVIAVESPMSVLSKWHVTPNMVATFGAKVTDQQVRQLAKFRRVILFYDNDDAGWDAVPMIVDRLSSYSDVRVVVNPYDGDPADMPDDLYLALVHDAVPYSLWEEPRTLVALEGKE